MGQSPNNKMMTILTIAGVLAVCIIILLLLFACCKVAADADRQSERDYARLMRRKGYLRES